MKNVGKIAALVMIMSLAFVLTACGSSASSSAASSSASSASASSAASAASASASAASSSTSADATTATSYVNEYFGLEYTLPEGWEFADPAALKEMNTAVTSVTNNEGLAMIATNPTTGAMVIVGVVEASPETAGKTAQDQLNSQVEELQEGLKTAGIDHMSTDAEVTFNGLTRTLPANFTTMEIAGQKLVLGMAVAEKEGSFLDIVAAGTSEEEVQNSFTAFRAAAE